MLSNGDWSWDEENCFLFVGSWIIIVVNVWDFEKECRSYDKFVYRGRLI